MRHPSMKLEIDSARQKLAINIDNRSLQLTLAKTLVDAAWHDSAKWKEYYAEATSIYESVLADDPENGIALVNLGAVFSNRGNHQLAMQYYRRAESLAWDDGNLQRNIGIAQVNLEDNERGIRHLKSSHAMKKHPDTIQAYFDPQAH